MASPARLEEAVAMLQPPVAEVLPSIVQLPSEEQVEVHIAPLKDAAIVADQHAEDQVMKAVEQPPTVTPDAFVCVTDNLLDREQDCVPDGPKTDSAYGTGRSSPLSLHSITHKSQTQDDYAEDKLTVPAADIVTYTLASEYDEHKPVLLDASDPLEPPYQRRFVTKHIAVDVISRLTGVFEPGVVVCMHVENDITYPLIYFGILASACIWTGSNTAYTTRELAHHFRISASRYIIVEAKRAQAVADAVALAGITAEIIIFTDLLESKAPASSLTFQGCRTLHDVIKPCATKITPTIDPDSVAALFSTSGTTGLPKMAARTHRALVTEAMGSYDNDHLKPYTVRKLFTTPIFHAFSAPLMLINPLKHGYPTYFVKRYDDTFPLKVFQFGITETAGVPTLLKRLSELPPQKKVLLQDLRTLWCAGARLGENVRDQFLSMFNDKSKIPRIVQVWGMSEGGWFSTFTYPDIDLTGSVGRLLQHNTVRIDNQYLLIGANGDQVQAGEIVIKGPSIMRGYVGNDTANLDAFSLDGFLKTGDVGYQQSDGRIYLVDRVKDLIKVNGWQVSPSELQDVLLGCPLVQDAAVIGASTREEDWPVAFVVPREPSATPALIKTYLLSQCARYKVSACEVRLLTAIPKNSIGKVDKGSLRQLL